MKPLRFCHRAMACDFEVLLEYPDSHYAAKAAQAAFVELDRLESLLSRFLPNSDIARISTLKKGQSILVSPETMECLQVAQQVYRQTGGLFDITVGGLVDLWKEQSPSMDAVQKMLQSVGMNKLKIHPETMSVEVNADGIMVDLGGIGKGYAVKQIAAVLNEWKVHQAIIHGGMSTLLALEPPAGAAGWKVQLTNPVSQQIIRVLQMKREALSCSGLRRGTDMIHPVTGLAIQDKSAVWVKGGDPAVCDALSTASMVMSLQQIERLTQEYPSVGIFVVLKDKPNQPPIQYGCW
ncbi:MAG TPA: FAD:protein FMN transferase [Anaerohalosphaeraceae bacterium]|nr:FAD:protein FMN transferase [Anaerohalosphaeraceae bacterium]